VVQEVLLVNMAQTADKFLAVQDQVVLQVAAQVMVPIKRELITVVLVVVAAEYSRVFL
jgi:hypothetical protein